MIRRGDALVVKGLSQEVSNLLSRVRIPASALPKKRIHVNLHIQFANVPF